MGQYAVWALLALAAYAPLSALATGGGQVQEVVVTATVLNATGVPGSSPTQLLISLPNGNIITAPNNRLTGAGVFTAPPALTTGRIQATSPTPTSPAPAPPPPPTTLTTFNGTPVAIGATAILPPSALAPGGGPSLPFRETDEVGPPVNRTVAFGQSVVEVQPLNLTAAARAARSPPPPPPSPKGSPPPPQTLLLISRESLGLGKDEGKADGQGQVIGIINQRPTPATPPPTEPYGLTVFDAKLATATELAGVGK